MPAETKAMKGTLMSSRVDLGLALKVREALTKDERLSAHPIEVSVIDRIVTLEGLVQSYRRRVAALEIAQSMDGCRGVVDKLVVTPAGRMSDARIADHVRVALGAHADITKEVITVDVNHGTATLNGTVSSPWERALAEDVALSARGVKEVCNMIMVDLNGTIEDEALTHNILHAIRETEGLRRADIQVAVAGEAAVLSGEVPMLWQRLRAQKVAERFRVQYVRNEIRVR